MPPLTPTEFLVTPPLGPKRPDEVAGTARVAEEYRRLKRNSTTSSSRAWTCR